MNEEQFKEFLKSVHQSIASAVKDNDEAKTLSTQIVDALKEQGTNWKSEVEKQSEARKDVEQKLKDSEDEVSTLKETVESTKQELADLKQSVAEQKRVSLYEQRLQEVQNKYELDEKELNIVSAELNTLEDTDEAFASYTTDKLCVIFAHKDKEVLAAAKAEEDAKKNTSTASQQDDNADDSNDDNDDGDDLDTNSSADANVPNSNKGQSDEKSLFERVKENLEIEVSI